MSLPHSSFTTIIGLPGKFLIELLNDVGILFLSSKEIVLQILNEFILPFDLLVLVINNTLKSRNRLLSCLC